VDLCQELKLDQIVSEPDVWVARLVIFEKIVPEPIILREVQLRKGLNIIWAEEPEDEDSSAEINGHSAGKTTFCRFLRYVLGESTCGTKSNMELFRRELPYAYVAAELYVRQKKWAVIRPIGTGRVSYILPESSIEELLKNRKQAVYQDEYPRRVGLDSLLNDFDTGAVVRTGEVIEWGHILAWCTRDQEARFQNIYDWRSTRSDSDWPNFRFTKADPLFVMRATLGLFLPEELKGEENLAELLKQHKKLEKDLEELRREPQFRVNLYDRDLRRRLVMALGEETGIENAPLHSETLSPGLDRLTVLAREKFESDIASMDKERSDLQQLVDDLGATISQHEVNLKRQEALFNLDGAAKTELDAGLSKRNKTREFLEEHGHSLCYPGDTLYTECTYVQNRQQILQMAHQQDARSMKQTQLIRIAQQNKIETEKTRMTNEIDRVRTERAAVTKKRDDIQSKLRVKRENLRDMDNAFTELQKWAQYSSFPDGFQKLGTCQKNLEKTTRAIARLEKELGTLLTEHDTSKKLLASIFSASVRSVLSSGTYDGLVNFKNRELGFCITHGAAMSGEAVETLSVLLADVACLIFNTVSNKAHFPGFLLHDSPREADLGIRIYRSFIRFAASLQKFYGGPEKCPFQYVLTTTTAPPIELQDNDTVRMQLNAAQKDGLLLRRNLALDNSSQVMPQLF
jgi:hypothetical protein